MAKNLKQGDWEEFCNVVLHERRFFFQHVNVGRPHMSAWNVIESIAERLCDYPLTVGRGEHLYRCRANPRSFETDDMERELGPPPAHLARASRMSPTGISRFYVADSPETAVAETADAPGEFALADFEVVEEFQVLDLCRPDEWPADFGGFLTAVVNDMVKPIARDDRVHLDYIPTQIFTECFANNWVDNQSRPIRGLRYPSSRRPDGHSLVLFYAETDHLNGATPLRLDGCHNLPVTLQFGSSG